MAFGVSDRSPQISVLYAWSKATHALRGIPAFERRKIRESAGISRATLAEMLNITVGKLRAFEDGAQPTGDDACNYHTALLAMMQSPIEEPLSAEERAKLREYFDKGEICAHCRGIHARACPRVKRLSYHSDGALAGIEFWPDGKWPTENVIFPDSPEMAE